MMLAFEAHCRADATAEGSCLAQRGAQHLSGETFSRLEDLREGDAHFATGPVSAIGNSTIVSPEGARSVAASFIDNTMTMATIVDPSNLALRCSRSCCNRNDKKRHRPSTLSVLSATLNRQEEGVKPNRNAKFQSARRPDAAPCSVITPRFDCRTYRHRNG